MPNQTSLHVVKLDGALVVASAPEIRSRLIGSLEGAASVALDLSEAVEIDVSFLQILVAAKKMAAAERKELTILPSGSDLLVAQSERCGLARDDMPAIRLS